MPRSNCQALINEVQCGYSDHLVCLKHRILKDRPAAILCCKPWGPEGAERPTYLHPGHA